MAINVEDYLHLVERIAKKLLRGLPDQVTMGDLRGPGYLGLMDAATKFDPERNVKFSTYCVSRIRGAMQNELRKMDWVPRLVRQKEKLGEEEAVQMNNFSGIPYINREFSENEDAKPYDPEDSSPLPDEIVNRKLEIRRAIMQLKPKYRQAVELYYFKHCTLKEAAAYMGATESRVCQILKKVKPILERLLKDKP